MAAETIAIIGGAGELGFGLALRWARAGAPIVIGSRDKKKAEDAAARIQDRVGATAGVRGAENADAAGAASIVVVTVPFAAQAGILKDIKGALKDAILVDATVPLAVAYGGKPTRLVGVWEGSAAEAARALVPAQVPVLAAFHSVSADALQDLSATPDCDVLVCGDDAAAKGRLFPLIRMIDGLRPIDSGPLEMARLVEGITPILIGLNRRNKGAHAGIRITGLTT